MDMPMTVGVYRRPASRINIVAHLFGLLAFILLLVWLVHYQGGLEYDSDNPNRVFNVHPFLMFSGFIFLIGEAMMAYRTFGTAQHDVTKFIHMLLHLIALCLGILGICAVFKFHDMIKAVNVYSLHSWVGIGTFSLFCLQWLVGFCAFLFPKASRATRERYKPWHACGGRALLYMSICAALTGLMEKATFLKLQHNNEGYLINFTGLAILLFGIFVDLSITLYHFAV